LNPRATQTSKRTATGWVVALTAIGSLMAALDTLVVSTSLSSIRLDLGASLEDLEWTVNAYNLSFAVLLITAAAVGDRYGRRRFYAIGLGLFAAASAASALAPSVGVLIAARAVQGAGAALVLTLGLTLVTAAFPPEKRGAAIGLFSAVTGIASRRLRSQTCVLLFNLSRGRRRDRSPRPASGGRARRRCGRGSAPRGARRLRRTGPSRAGSRRPMPRRWH
jgi:sugar phosphate permease